MPKAPNPLTKTVELTNEELEAIDAVISYVLTSGLDPTVFDDEDARILEDARAKLEFDVDAHNKAVWEKSNQTRR